MKNQRGDGVIISLIGNKIDIEDREVTIEEGMKMAEENDILFKEVSAKSGANIQ